VLRKSAEHIGTDRLLELIWPELLIWARVDPRIRRLGVAVLPETLDQVAKASAQHASRTRTTEKSTQLAEHTALVAWPIVLAGSAARHLLPFTKRLGDFVPVLITRDGKKSQQCNHRRHSAAHFSLLYVMVEHMRATIPKDGGVTFSYDAIARNFQLRSSLGFRTGQ
jgi:hypothetical protein